MEQSASVISVDPNLEDCEPLKVYRVVPDPLSESQGLLRVLDDSGEDYLYPATSFLHVSLEGRAAGALDAMLQGSTDQPGGLNASSEHLF